MENTDSFNLRWDDFEVNTRVTLKELRDEREFCDVTLACDGKQVSAHKVILAGSSKFFQQILKQNPHPHPLLYLKGVRFDYLLSMLDFVYTGETNINEKELGSFLDVANDLQIKGLIEKNPPRKTSAKEGDTIPCNVKKEAGSPLQVETPSHSNTRCPQSTCEDGPIDTPFDGNIKFERNDRIHSTASFGMDANSTGLNDKEDEDMIDLKTEVPDSYGIGSNFKNDQMTADWYEQSEDFFDDASRPNSGKLTPAFTSQDQLLACQRKSDLPLQVEFSGSYFNSSIVKSKCEENHDRNQVLVDDNVKTKPGVTSNFYFNFEDDSYVETDDFLRGADNNDQVFSDCALTGRGPVDSVSKSEKNANYSHEKGEKSDVSVRHDEEPGENHNEKEFSTMTKERNVCSVCGKSFRDGSDLKRHSRIHTGEKPFPCSFCPKTFRTSYQLKEHTSIHTGEKPFPCLFCPKTFRMSSMLNDHTRIHTREKRFQCLVCFKRFTQLSHLNVHKKRKKQCSMKLGE